MKIGLVVASLLAVAVQSLFETDSVFARHAYHIEEFGVTKLSGPPARLRNAMESHISIHITTKDHIFDLDLALNQFIFSEDSVIYSSRQDENGNQIEIEKEYRSYRGNATVRSRAFSVIKDKAEPVVVSEIACVTFYPDDRAHVMIITPDDIFTIDRIEIHQESEGITFSGEDKNIGMSMTRLSDRGEDSLTPFHKTIMQTSMHKPNPQRRRLVIKFTDCWPGQSSFDRVASIGIIVDNKYYCQVVTNSDTASCQIGGQDSKVLSNIQSIINDAGAVYAAQFNIHLRLGTTYLGASAASLSPNDASCPDMSTQLNTLKAWRATYYNQHTSTDSNTLFHLFTNCHPPPGVVGLAYIGVLCNAASGYSTGVVNHVYDQTWLTFAHEGGHNFGMTHSFQNGQGTTGGIMDYGDGIYQGEYQFEPGRKPEVCQELTSALSTTYSGFLPVNRCLPQFNEQPVPAPTLQPTKKPTTTNPPTKKPTNPTTPAPIPTKNPTKKPTAKPTKKPTAKPTAKPTRRPTTAPPTRRPTTTTAAGTPPTKKPTGAPTSKPSAAPTTVQYYARWYKTGTYGDCYPSCGNFSYATEILKCCASDLSSSNNCNWEIDVSYCDPATKPTPSSLKCSVSSCTDPATLCGNGVLNSGEYCDPSIDDCCLLDCSGFRVTNECVRKNTRVDAAFTDRNGRVYIFQGPYYTRFADFYQWYYNHPESGYPKTIKGNFPLQQCTQNIGSIVARKSNQLFVFCGTLEYVKVDLDNQLQLAGVYNAATDWNLPQEFINCGQVTAALGLTYNMLLFCQNIWISVPYARTSTSTATISIHSITEFGFTLQNGYIITAVMYDRNSGYWAWFQGFKNYVSMQAYDIVSGSRQTVSIFNGSSVSNISSLEGQGGCYQDSCSQCVSGVCKQCADGYLLYGSRCFNDSVLAYLQCDEGSQSDASLVSGGFSTLFDFNYTTGVSGNALVFDGQTKLQMKPLKRNVTDFSISAYFKPKSLNQATFVNIDDKFIFSYESVDNSSFQVMVQMSGYKFTCYVATPMKLHQWNKIQVIVNDSIIWTGANGFFHMRAFDSNQQGLTLELNFDTWSIGADYNGIDGYLDEFIVVSSRENVEASKTNESSNDKTFGLEIWQLALIGVAAGLLVIGIAAFVIYKFVHRRKLGEQIPDTYNVNFT